MIFVLHEFEEHTFRRRNMTPNIAKSLRKHKRHYRNEKHICITFLKQYLLATPKSYPAEFERYNRRLKYAQRYPGYGNPWRSVPRKRESTK